MEKNLAITGHEQNWLIGFSKSGLGGQDLILKHPDIFALAASWDFPAGMSSYDGLGADTASSYGTDANFQANYRLTAAFVKAHRGPFLRENRIWIGGNREFPTDMSDYAKLLTKRAYVLLEKRPGSCVTTGTVAGFPTPWPHCGRTALASTRARTNRLRLFSHAAGSPRWQRAHRRPARR